MWLETRASIICYYYCNAPSSLLFLHQEMRDARIASNHPFMRSLLLKASQ